MSQNTWFLIDEPTWAQRVKAVRLKRDVTQEEFAIEMGVDRATISRWESMVFRPYSAAAEKFVVLESELEMEEPS